MELREALELVKNSIQLLQIQATENNCKIIASTCELLDTIIRQMGVMTSANPHQQRQNADHSRRRYTNPEQQSPCDPADG